MKIWPDVLRQACEVAGLEPRGIPGLFWVNTALSVGLDHPMLPAYVAELLVAQIVEHDPRNKRLREFDIYLHRCVRLSLSTSTARQRILAAMVALEKLTIEQAREVT